LRRLSRASIRLPNNAPIRIDAKGKPGIGVNVIGVETLWVLVAAVLVMTDAEVLTTVVVGAIDEAVCEDTVEAVFVS